MGRRGPLPKKQTKARGDTRKQAKAKVHRAVKVKPAETTGRQPPEWLKKIAREKWAELAPRLEEQRILTVNDLDLLALYCDSWQELADADATIEREGEFFHTEKGYVGPHPAVGKRNKAVERIRKIGGELGLSPRGRQGLEIEPSRQATALQRFLESSPE